VLERKLDPAAAGDFVTEELSVSEKMYRWMMNQDAVATEKLAEGIRGLHEERKRLLDYIHGNRCPNAEQCGP
jgi:transaldolase